MRARILLTLVLLTPLARAAAQDAPDLDALKTKAIVVVLAKAIDAAHGNVPLVSQGTGFFISSEGFLITSYHLRSKLPVSDDEVSYEVRFGSSPGDPTVSARYQWGNDACDLLMLSVAIGDHLIAVLPRSSLTRDSIKKGVTPLYTGGYPHGVPFLTRHGVVLAFGLLDPRPAWVTDIGLIEGQSGSPVLLGDGTVIAVARGNDADNPSVGIIVPVKIIPNGFWDK
jgi:S1-C subfamily serine protease